MSNSDDAQTPPVPTDLASSLPVPGPTKPFTHGSKLHTAVLGLEFLPRPGPSKTTFKTGQQPRFLNSFLARSAPLYEHPGRKLQLLCLGGEEELEHLYPIP